MTKMLPDLLSILERNLEVQLLPLSSLNNVLLNAK